MDQNLSCAELTVLAEQSAMINRLMATWLGVYLYRLLQSRDLDLMATFVNLRTGVTRSTPITGGRIVFPSRPGQSAGQPQVAVPEAAAAPEGTEAPTTPEPGPGCPVCGGEIIDGQDEWQGLLVHVSFCTQCNWREEGCPECQGEIVEEELLEAATGETRLGLHCTQCDWRRPFPVEQPVQ
jgi:hypothetical protein